MSKLDPFLQKTLLGQRVKTLECGLRTGCGDAWYELPNSDDCSLCLLEIYTEVFMGAWVFTGHLLLDGSGINYLHYISSFCKFENI